MPARPAKRLRDRIAFAAARLLYDRAELEYTRAKRKAARSLGVRFQNDDLPSNREIRDQLERIQRAVDDEHVTLDLRALRCDALRWMRKLHRFRPRLVGAVADGATPTGRAMEIDLWSAAVDDVRAVVAAEPGVRLRIEPARRDPAGAAYVPAVVLSWPEVRFALRDIPPDPDAPGLDADRLAALLAEEQPDADLDAEIDGLVEDDRFESYRMLLRRMDRIRPLRFDPVGPPVGLDLLHHSLQAFDRAMEERPYDEEFLTAALLHDVGWTSDSRRATAAALDLLDGVVTRRTRWFIENLSHARQHRNHELPTAERRRLEAFGGDWTDLMLLAEIDAAANQTRAATTSLEEALEYLESLDDGRLWNDGLCSAELDEPPRPLAELTVFPPEDDEDEVDDDPPDDD
ncbi:MAG: hypothetical protein ACRDD1_00930, partial [Planctomycetia bacterium]